MGCATNYPPTPEEETLSFEKNDEDEYDILVMDSQYDTYLKSIAKPMDFYSEFYYKSQNRDYVMEWNYRHNNPIQYDPHFYSTYIDYDWNKEYGINLEYKLYNYFKFLKWRYKIDLKR